MKLFAAKVIDKPEKISVERFLVILVKPLSPKPLLQELGMFLENKFFVKGTFALKDNDFAKNDFCAKLHCNQYN